MIESKEPYIFSTEKEQMKKTKKNNSKYSVAGTQKAADHKIIASEEVVPAIEDTVSVEEKEAAPAINVPDIRTVTCKALLNVRKSPNGEILRTIPNGTKVEVIEELEHWCKLVDGTYVMKRFLTK